MSYTIGELSVMILSAFLFAELVGLFASAPKLLSRPFDKEDAIKPEGREYATRALTLGGLTFAAIALLAGSFSSNLVIVVDSLYVFVFGTGLFLVSYYIEVLVRLRRLYWIIQDKTLNFGYLSNRARLTHFLQPSVA